MRALRSLRVVPIWLMRSASMVVSCDVLRGGAGARVPCLGQAGASGETGDFLMRGLSCLGACAWRVRRGLKVQSDCSACRAGAEGKVVTFVTFLLWGVWGT